jgi:uncharacterized protein
MEERYRQLKMIAENEMEGASPAHDINHVMRVYNLCLELAKYEPSVDLGILRTAALLHDIARTKEDEDAGVLGVDHAILGAEMSDKILRKLGYPEEKIEHIKHCIASHRFRGENPPRTIEAEILSDADKLDVLGATGIARSFTIGGENGQKIYSDTPIDEYIKENLVGGKANGRIKDPSKHASNLEFETKFKQIPNRLYTQKAREIARERLEYMKQFFERLKKEINAQLHTTVNS